MNKLIVGFLGRFGLVFMITIIADGLRRQGILDSLDGTLIVISGLLFVVFGGDFEKDF